MVPWAERLGIAKAGTLAEKLETRLVGTSVVPRAERLEIVKAGKSAATLETRWVGSCVTKTIQNQDCPNQRRKVTKMRHQNMQVNSQRVLVDDPDVNGIEDTSC